MMQQIVNITVSLQKFRASTQKRYKLDSSSPRANSYGTPPPGSIRRTPGKLYSPFNCATPPPPRTHEAKRLQHRPSRYVTRSLQLLVSFACSPTYYLTAMQVVTVLHLFLLNISLFLNKFLEYLFVIVRHNTIQPLQS